MRFGSCLLRSSNGLPSVYESSITVTDWRGLLGWHTEQEEGECSWGLCSNHKTKRLTQRYERPLNRLTVNLGFVTPIQGGWRYLALPDPITRRESSTLRHGRQVNL